eukprot:CAMPEP_0114268138 /NCGR_PEP_ID=MMETSP0058-20121206/25750_1 /TAXON_ID=36894 /ORGANISM="Pyramimonas parkeae, CCMP726" /LENGTH=509 /DNA_ID=CAMNT_0001386199 /DNA_START=144 /DNA_END=1674 /DNA_ORIENTATION=+
MRGCNTSHELHRILMLVVNLILSSKAAAYIQALNPKVPDIFAHRRSPATPGHGGGPASRRPVFSHRNDIPWKGGVGPFGSQTIRPWQRGLRNTLACGTLSTHDVAVGVLSRFAGAAATNSRPAPMPKLKLKEEVASKGDVLWEERLRDGEAQAFEPEGTSTKARSLLQSQSPSPQTRHRTFIANYVPPRPAPPPAPPAPKPKALLQIESVKRGWLKYFPHATVFQEDMGASPLDLTLMLLHLRRMFAGRAWYLLVHDDTYVHPLNLLCELRPNNPKLLWYVGATHCIGPNFRCMNVNIKYMGLRREENFGGWNNGGAGVAMSGELVRKLDLKQCLTYYNRKWAFAQFSGSDVVLACCVADHLGSRVHVKGFTAGPPGFHECQCNHDRQGMPLGGAAPTCSLSRDEIAKNSFLQISYHGVNFTLMNQLSQAELKGKAAKFFTNVTTVYHVGDVWLYPNATRSSSLSAQPMLRRVKNNDWTLDGDLVKLLVRGQVGIEQVHVSPYALKDSD